MSEATIWEKSEALAEPFPPEAINQLERGGVLLDYVGHAEVTERLNQVDPTWSLEPYAVDDDGGPLIRTNGEVSELWVNLTVCGVTRLAVGTAKTSAYSGEVSKELVSDAIRNGAMRFGVALDLWKKHDSVAAPQQARQPYSGAPANVPEGRTVPLASGADNSGAMSQGQSRNLYRLWHHVLHYDKTEYLEAILIATGLELTDDRELTKNEAGKVISYLKQQAGEEDSPPVSRAQSVQEGPPPLEDPAGFDEEPF